MLTFDVKEIEEKITTSPKKSGCGQIFFAITKEIGLKLCADEQTRNNIYERQKLAFENGLAPNIYGTIDNVEYDGRKRFGYFTEIVRVRDTTKINTEEYKEFISFHKQNLKQLIHDMRKIFPQTDNWWDWCFDDNHPGNTGIKDGKLICIDFD